MTIEIEQAVKTSRNEDRIVTVEVSDLDAALEAVREAAHEGEEVDYARNVDFRERRMIDVWGFDPTTNDESMTFRLNLVLDTEDDA